MKKDVISASLVPGALCVGAVAASFIAWVLLERTPVRSTVVESDVEIGHVGTGQEVEFNVSLMNQSDDVVRIIGSEMCCSASLESIPAEIAAKSTVLLRGSAYAPLERGPTYWEGKIFVDTGELETLDFIVSAAVDESLEDTLLLDKLSE